MKTCSKCGLTKSIEWGFYKRKHRNSGHSWCKQCWKGYNAARANTPEVSYSRRKTNLKIYGITPEEWDALFESQNKACALCFATSPRGNRWCLDHCHLTNRVCGIICYKCNIGIGHFEDTAELLSLATEYVGRTR